MKLLARVVFLVGAIAIAAFLLRSKPRDVTLVYELAPPDAPATLEVAIRRGTELVRRSELAVPPGGGELRHPVHLPEGEYTLSWRFYGPHPARGEAKIDIRNEDRILVPLRP